ncbi:MAG: hypothetical protein H0Z32_07655 [Bacillaceae bacterium]|nr:hypothetical protein [Bacillaceae bacterium]
MKKNQFAEVLKLISLFILIAGFYFLFDSQWLIFIFALLFFMLFLALAEIINLLHGIHIKLTENSELQEREKNRAGFYSVQPVSEKNKEKIHQYFANQNIQVKNIISTPYQEFCMVELQKEYKVIDLRGENPHPVPEGQIRHMENLLKWAKERKGIKLIK